jgi:hypothetical protein
MYFMTLVCDRYVYVIAGGDGRPCYIGVGKGDRMWHHIRDARHRRGGDTEKRRYLIRCLAKGYVPPHYKVAEDLTMFEATEYEKVLIAWYGRRDLGTGCLFNASAGGFGVKNHAKANHWKRGWKQSPEIIEKRIAPIRGRKRSDEG